MSADQKRADEALDAVPGEPVARLSDAELSDIFNACDFDTMVTADDLFYLIARAVEKRIRTTPSPATDPAATLIAALLAVQMSAVAIPDVAGEHAIKTATLAKVERALGAYSLSVPAKDRKRVPVTICCGRSECGGECGNEWAGMEDVSEPPAAVVGVEASQAWQDVRAERLRQISAKGWTPKHDDEHDDGSLARAAACYALGSPHVSDRRQRSYVTLWPWEESSWKQSPPRRMLVKAAALILAEIERLDRDTDRKSRHAAAEPWLG